MRRVAIGIGVPVGTTAAACVIIGLSLHAAAQTQGSSSDTDLASACRKLGTTSFEQIPGARDLDYIGNCCRRYRWPSRLL